MDDSAIVLKKKAPKPNGIALQGSLSQNFKIYPNPANNELVIESSIELNQIKYSIILGRWLWKYMVQKRQKTSLIFLPYLPGYIL